MTRINTAIAENAREPAAAALWGLLFALLLGIGVGGCQAPPVGGAAGGTVTLQATPNTPHPNLEDQAQPQVPEEGIIAGRSVQNRPLGAIVLGDGPEVILMLASIHGSEPAGTPLLYELATFLRHHPRYLDRRRVVLLLEANPDGLAQGTRTNARGVDLNRNFPASNRVNSARYGSAPLSEPEAAAIFDILERYAPARVVSIHQPLKCIDYDGPGLELATTMAASCSLPVRKLGARPGSLGAFVGLEQRIPIITLELPRGASRLDGEQLFAAYGRALLAAIVHPALPDEE